jgi:hypothetical protein
MSFGVLRSFAGERQNFALPQECGVPVSGGAPHSCGRLERQKTFVLRHSFECS